MARVLGRVRLSDWTDESTSVARQREYIEKWCEPRGHEIAGWAIDIDFSRSVRPFDAPEFGPWLKDPVKVASWDIVVAWRLDRFGAGWRLGPLFTWCLEHGKGLTSTTIDIDLKTPAGRIIASILSEFSQSELDSVQERVRGSRAYLAKVGRWPGGRPPFWLKPAQHPDGAGWTLRLDPTTAPVAQRIITEYLDHKPLNTICRHLSNDAVPTPQDYYRQRAETTAKLAGRTYRGKLPTGAAWRPRTLEFMLANPALLGWTTNDQSVVRDDEGHPIEGAEALITQDRYRDIQAETQRRKAGRGTRRESDANPLLGVLTCGRCGAPGYRADQVQKHRGREYHYVYYKVNCKHGRYIRADRVEAAVDAIVREVLGDTPRVERVFIPAEDHSSELEDARAALQELISSVDRVKSAGAKSVLQSQVAALDEQIFNLERLPTGPARYDIRPTGDTYEEYWDTATTEERRRMLLDAGIQVAMTVTNGEPSFEVLNPEDVE